MTRNGKIARMPYGIREELNRRLRNGWSGPALLKWLNEQEECLVVLDDEFESRPITKQNLSEWKQGGYKEWERKEETRERVHVLMEKADDLEADAGSATIGDRVATLLEVELAVAMEQLDDIKDPEKRWTRVKEITRELHRLRREDHHARKLRMAEEQYERREKEAGRERLLKLEDNMKNKYLLASIAGGGDETRKWTDWEIRVRHGLPMPLWWTNPQSAEDWSDLMMPYWEEERMKAREGGANGKTEDGGLKKEDGKGRDSKEEDGRWRIEDGEKGHRRDGETSPKSKVTQMRNGKESHRQDACATKAEKSKAVVPGQAKSDQKSGSVQPGQAEAGESKVHPPSSDYGATSSPKSKVESNEPVVGERPSSDFGAPRERGENGGGQTKDGGLKMEDGKSA